MSQRFVLFFFLVIPAWSSAQKFPFEFWHEGKIVLESGDTLRGQVKYSMQEDLVQLQTERTMETYTSRKVVFFEIFDVTIKRYRQFYSLPYAATGQYRAPVFFELLQEGKMTLLAREALESRTSSSLYYYGTYTRLVLVNKFFLIKESGTIVQFSGKKNDLIELMGTKGEKVAKYAKEKRLDFDKKYDVAQMVDYYNSLF